MRHVGISPDVTGKSDDLSRRMSRRESSLRHRSGGSSNRYGVLAGVINLVPRRRPFVGVAV